MGLVEGIRCNYILPKWTYFLGKLFTASLTVLINLCNKKKLVFFFLCKPIPVRLVLFS